MYSYTEENYLKAIYKLTENGGGNVNTNAIADEIQTKAASVTDMIKKLSDKKLLKYEKYKGVTLTEKGRKVAIETVRKHRLWECFLFDKLKFGWDEVHEIAEQLEHIQSEVLVDKLDAFLDYPTHDPHGDPIPTKAGIIKKSDFILLADAALLDWVVMTGVADHSTSFLQHLNKVGLALGTEMKVVDKVNYDGSMEIEFKNKKQVQLSKDVVKNIWVRIR
ncbi:MAG: metal-dependent transcriptional regulator [Bacteroidota bacterium]|jgi:DtxR family Mn-dependent transcriptional regulator